MHEQDPDARGSAPLASEPTRVHLRVSAVADQVANVRHAVLESRKRTGSAPNPATTSPSLSRRRARTSCCTRIATPPCRAHWPSTPIATTASSSSSSAMKGPDCARAPTAPVSASGSVSSAAWRSGWRSPSHDPVGAKITMIFAAPANAPTRARAATRSDRGVVETPTGMDARENDQEVRMQQSAERTTPTRALSAAEREWIRQQGRVSRAIEAAQRRSSGRFSRVTKPTEAARPDMHTNQRAPA